MLTNVLASMHLGIILANLISLHMLLMSYICDKFRYGGNCSDKYQSSIYSIEVSKHLYLSDLCMDCHWSFLLHRHKYNTLMVHHACVLELHKHDICLKRANCNGYVI